MDYVVLQKEATAPSIEQLRRALKLVKRLTEADAIKAAREAWGLLFRTGSLEEAALVQQALQAEGVPVEAVPANQLPKLPEAKFVKRLELQPQALLVYDPLGRSFPVPWAQVVLLSAGAVRHFGMTQTTTQEWVRSYNLISGPRYRLETDVRHKVEDDLQVRLEVFLTSAAMRFEIEATGFLFNFVLDRPGQDRNENLTQLVRVLAQRASQAWLNRGARALCDSAPIVLYPSKAALADESLWLLWRQAIGAASDLPALQNAGQA